MADRITPADRKHFFCTYTITFRVVSPDELGVRGKPTTKSKKKTCRPFQLPELGWYTAAGGCMGGVPLSIGLMYDDPPPPPGGD